MNRLILHVGASKCGSSALQTFLSSRPHHVSVDGDAIEYGAICPSGMLYSRPLILFAAGRVAGYASSMAAKDIQSQDTTWRDSVIRSINSRLRNGKSLILSNEGWFHRWRDLDDMEFFQRVEARIDVICYVRPQVPFMNSAWWQWGAWSDMTFGDWVEERLPSTRWGDIAGRWRQLDWVDSFTVRSLSGDIIQSFLGFLGVPQAHASNRSNSGLPGEILRIFQKYRTLRPDPRKAQIDFALSRHLGHLSSTPWVIDARTAAGIIERTRDSNDRLVALMEPSEARAVRADQSWWSAETFENRPVEFPIPRDLDYERLEKLCAEMARVIFDLEKKNRAMLQQRLQGLDEIRKHNLS